MSGEFAGYALDETMDAENDRWLYRMGDMSDAQAYDLGIIDHLGYYQHVPMFGRVGGGPVVTPESRARDLNSALSNLGAAINKLKQETRK